MHIFIMNSITHKIQLTLDMHVIKAYKMLIHFIYKFSYEILEEIKNIQIKDY